MRIVLALAGLALLAPGAFALLAPTPLATHTVAMRGSMFDPPVLQIVAGDTVNWVNRDPGAHTVTDVLGGFDSGSIPASGSYARSFPSSGAVLYQCTFHTAPDGAGVMYGVLVVV